MFTFLENVDSIKTKMQYEWKNIYRMLSSNDVHENGIISVRKFDEILQANNSFISNEDLKNLQEKFGSNKDKTINYLKLSEELGL